jgi:hypothetical protein
MDEVTQKFVGGERRLTMLLVGYWQEAREDHRRPRASDFTALVPAELLADCFTYEPAAEPPAEPAAEPTGAGEGGRLRDIGAALARVSGIAVTEMARGDAPSNSLLGVAIKFLGRALQEGTPVLDDGAFEDQRGVRRLYRTTLLPLENDAGEVALVIGGARCKAA